MSDIDHKATALAIVNLPAHHRRPGEIEEAQIHATLYLAEQQRIANLIEISRDRHTNLDRSLKGEVGLNPATGEEAPIELLSRRTAEVDVLIREGLGLA